jgi:hypothetical protein
MLDVHVPHEKIHGMRDFFLHLFTITIGLLIALSLEGCVEWQHHRHLVREAEAALHDEIENNAKQVANIRQQVQNHRTQLDQDLAVLAQMRTHAGVHDTLSLGFSMQSFDDVSWKTAQTTGAFAYMPYADAREFSDIYSAQDELYKAQQQVVEDVMRAAAPVVTLPKDVQPGPSGIDEMTTRIGMVEMRLSLVDSLINSLQKSYQKYQSEHA